MKYFRFSGETDVRAKQHVMSWHLGQVGRGAARVAGAPMMVAYGQADHA